MSCFVFWQKRCNFSISFRWDGAARQLLVLLLRECLARPLASPLDARSSAAAHQRGRARPDHPSRRPDDHLHQLGRQPAAAGRAGRGHSLPADPGGERGEQPACDKLPPDIGPNPPLTSTITDKVTVSDGHVLDRCRVTLGHVSPPPPPHSLAVQLTSPQAAPLKVESRLIPVKQEGENQKNHSRERWLQVKKVFTLWIFQTKLQRVKWLHWRPSPNAEASIPKKAEFNSKEIHKKCPVSKSKEIRLNPSLLAIWPAGGKGGRSWDSIPVNSSVKVVWHWGGASYQVRVQTA